MSTFRIKRNFLLGACALLSVQAMNAQTLPAGMTRLTPENLEVGGLMAFVNPNSPQRLLTQHGDLFFSARDDEHGYELWVTGTTPASTRMVKDINPGPESSNPGTLVRMGGKIYFKAETPEYGTELWTSDGTEAGTHMVKDIYPGTYGSRPGGLVVLNNKVLFTAVDEESEINPVIDPEKEESWIWSSDGTEAGTVCIAKVPMNGYFEVVGNKAFFAGIDTENNEALWVTDGTQAGTKMLKNINNRPTPDDPTFKTGPAGIGSLRNVNDKWVVFRAETVAEQVGKDCGSEIWYSDGTEEGTKWIGFDFAKGMLSGKPYPTEFAETYGFGDTLFFRANNGVNGVEPCIWVLSEPIVEGKNPRMIFDINHWSGAISYPSWPSSFFKYQDYVFMQANGGYYLPDSSSPTTQYATGYSLWRAPIATLDTCIYQRQFDGTEIAPGATNDNASRFTQIHGRLFFTAQDLDNNNELWMMKDQNTTPVKVVDLPDNGSPSALNNIDGCLYFSSTTMKALFRYDFGDGGVGFNELEEASPKLTVFPNPAIDKITVTAGKEIKQINLFDIIGRKVLSHSGDNVIDVTSLNGWYVLKVEYMDGTQGCSKVLVK